MGLKPARIYRIPKKRLYTRKEYMSGTPASKITIFDMGALDSWGKFPLEVSIVAKETGQITHNALEASRIASNRYMQKRAGRANYYLKFRVYPHVILRENKQATGAGADRVSEGMRRAFGKAVSLGARVSKGQKIISIRTHPNHYFTAREALRRAAAKLPMPCGILVDRGKELLKL